MVVPHTAPSAAAKPRSAHAKKKARAHAKAEARRQQEADKVEAMPVTNHRAAGIDIGDRSHWVCVGFTKDDDSDLIKEFATHTEGLRQIVAYLREYHITTVAMESTGIYWVPLFEMLEKEGFTVYPGQSGLHVANLRPAEDRQARRAVDLSPALVRLAAGGLPPRRADRCLAQLPASARHVDPLRRAARAAHAEGAASR